MEKRILHGAGAAISCLGLGTVKFGRNEQVKYPASFDLPDDRSVLGLLDLARESGINVLDTAPAYGSSEARLGALLGARREEWNIVTKAGEDFEGGRSCFDFSPEAIRRSIDRTLRRLRTDRVECVLLHSDGRDVEILEKSGAVEALREAKTLGKARTIGISTKTVEGGLLAVRMGLDAVMVTYNPWNQTEKPVLDLAAKRGDCSVFIKKAFGSGWFGSAAGSEASPPGDPVYEAIRFIFQHPAATSVITGTINREHLLQNVSAINRVFSS